MSALGKEIYAAADAHGIPRSLFYSLVMHESGGRISAKSPVGALGLTQLMPATARGLGVKDPLDPVQNLDGGARYLASQYKAFGSWRLALAAYNAGPGAVKQYNGVPPYKETQRYVTGIMRDYLGHPTKTAPLGDSPDVSVAQGLTAPPPNTGLNAPASTTVPTGFSDAGTAQAFAGLGAIGAGESPEYELGKLTDAVSSTPAPPAPKIPALPASTPLPAAPVAPVTRTAANPTHGASGQISIAQGANRAGVKIKPDILQFAKAVAAVWGKELTITTGTNHNQFVAGEGHTQSAHWTGEAVDIAVNHNSPGQVDPQLTKLGQDALIAAGMPEAQARKQHGGVYNIGRFQILFNTTVGGNHYNHLHLGMRKH